VCGRKKSSGSRTVESRWTTRKRKTHFAFPTATNAITRSKKRNAVIIELKLGQRVPAYADWYRRCYRNNTFNDSWVFFGSVVAPLLFGVYLSTCVWLTCYNYNLRGTCVERCSSQKVKRTYNFLQHFLKLSSTFTYFHEHFFRFGSLKESMWSVHSVLYFWWDVTTEKIKGRARWKVLIQWMVYGNGR